MILQDYCVCARMCICLHVHVCLKFTTSYLFHHPFRTGTWLQAISHVMSVTPKFSPRPAGSDDPSLCWSP